MTALLTLMLLAPNVLQRGAPPLALRGPGDRRPHVAPLRPSGLERLMLHAPQARRGTAGALGPEASARPSLPHRGLSVLPDIELGRHPMAGVAISGHW